MMERTITSDASETATLVTNETTSTSPKSPRRLYDLFKKSLRLLHIPAKRYDMDEDDDMGMDFEPTERRSPAQERDSETEMCRLSPSSTRCTDGKSSLYYQEPSRTPVSEVADFSNLDDPFACHTLGSPQIVKDIDSALPPKKQGKNKEIEARRRARQAVQRPRTASASTEPARPKIEWAVVAAAQTATLRRACMHPLIPTRTPSVRSSRWKSLPPLPPIRTSPPQHEPKFHSLSFSPPTRPASQGLTMQRTSIDVY